MPWSPTAEAQPCRESHQIQAYILVLSIFEAKRKQPVTTIISEKTGDESASAWKSFEGRGLDPGSLLQQALGAN